MSCFCHRKFVVVMLEVAVLAATGARAEVQLPALISDGMVLQQGVKVNIWGAAAPGEHVSVTLKDQKASGVANGGGEWKVQLGPLRAGGPFTLTVAGKNTITVHDVLVGELWICSGQSNMAMTVNGVYNAQDEIARADYPTLRLFTVRQELAAKPQREVSGYWVRTRPDTVGGFSAAAYFFGRDLQKALNVPIGLINTSWGGTPAEAWTSRETLESDPDFKSILEAGEKLISPYPKLFDDYNAQLAQWRQASDQAEAEGAPVPIAPALPDDPRRNPHRPASLFNAMIMPLINYAIRGAIWYQGESNTSRAVQYRKLFPAMIRDWRRVWGEGDFPFLFVQLANYGITPPIPSWPALREAQAMALALPQTGMAVTIDIGDGGDIHPKNKQEVGYRLALAAEGIAYGMDVIYSGPVYESMAVEGDKIRLRFKYVYGGFAPKGPQVTGLEIAGEDRKFVRAQATMEGDTLLVSSSSVAHPVAVRYAWAMNPSCNLYNRAGLPAAPFRTDDWEDLLYVK
jgi:sialate O-acetylesterase